MPIIGDIKRGREIQKGISKTGWSQRHIWSACRICGKERWVRYKKENPESVRCQTCARQRVRSLEERTKIAQTVKSKNLRGERSFSWKGGRQKGTDGYILVLLQPNDFFYSMTTSNGRIKEHRLIMAKYLKRCLLPWEVVHHINGIKDDNRIENLRLIKGHADHLSYTILQKENVQLRRRIKELERKLAN